MKNSQFVRELAELGLEKYKYSKVSCLFRTIFTVGRKRENKWEGVIKQANDIRLFGVLVEQPYACTCSEKQQIKPAILTHHRCFS